MARGVPVQPALRARIVKLIRKGVSRNQIARDTGVSTATVSRIAASEELSFENKQAAVATSAKHFDRAAARADIIDRLYKRSQKVLTRLEAAKFTYRLATETGSQLVRDDDPPAADEKNLSAALVNYLKQARELEQVDVGNGSPMESMLGRLALKMGLVDD